MTEQTKMPPTEKLEEMPVPVIVCPHCLRGSDFNIRAHVPKELDSRTVCAIGSCRLCKKEVWFELSNNDPADVRSYYPRSVVSLPEGIPPAVHQAFEEALKCQEAGAPNGALEMCRRAIKEALVDLGAPPKGDLPMQLKALVDAQKITPDLKDWADQARIGGKLAAHGTGGDEWGQPEKAWGERQDAEDVIGFCTSFFEYAYTMTKRLQDRRSKPAS
jgi:hypothetical protein